MFKFWKRITCLALTLAAAPAYAETESSLPQNWGMHLLAAASPVREKMVWFYNDLLTPIIVAITLFVLALLVWVVARYNAKANPVPSKTTHNTLLEVIWTLIPVIILIVIVVPSMKILYYADRTADAEMTLKVTGYQWYWGYEYPDDGGINYMANVVKDKDLQPGQLRLLSTDNPVVLPIDTTVRILITASDVIHSWSVPAFGIKLDAVPGRLNETWVRPNKLGTFYGQCSQLCGQNHGFMPIEVKVVTKEEYAAWVKAQGGKLHSPPADNKDVAKTPGAAAGGVKSTEAPGKDAAIVTDQAAKGVAQKEKTKSPGAKQKSPAGASTESPDAQSGEGTAQKPLAKALKDKVNK